MSGFPDLVLDLLHKRSRGLCEGCRLMPATEAHHRQYRSRRGPETLSNALHLCGWGNALGCHGIAHSGLGEERGWSVRSGLIPAEVPVLVLPGPYERWLILNDLATPPKAINPLDARALMVSFGAAGRSLANRGED